MNRSEQINELATALAIAQGQIEGAKKDSANPFFKSKYADLAAVWDAVRTPLSKNGLSVMQLPSADGPRVTITTILAHNSGQWIQSELTMTAKEDTPQAVGSAITYARRYALQSVAGVAPEDDDAESAQGRRPNPTGQWARGGQPPAVPTTSHKEPATKALPVPKALESAFALLDDKGPSVFANVCQSMLNLMCTKMGSVDGAAAYDKMADAFYQQYPDGSTDVKILKSMLYRLWEAMEAKPAKA